MRLKYILIMLIFCREFSFYNFNFDDLKKNVADNQPET